MSLASLLAVDRIACMDDARDRDEVLEAAARLIAAGTGIDAGDVAASLRRRERMGSTAIGDGVAIPHGRSARATTATGAFLRLSEPVDFGAPDGEPVDLVFALVVPEHFAQQHLMLLANLAEMFGDAGFRQQLRQAPDSAALYTLLSDWQAAHPAAA